MAKYEEVSEMNADIFKEIVSEVDLERVVNVIVLADNRQKEIGKVTKANPLVKFMTNEDVIIIINEKIYDGLEDEQKRLVADELVTWIGYDFEKDKVNIVKPDINVHTGVLRKYTFPIYERLQETIKSLYDAKNNQEAEEEEAEV